jgi:hypothetical protein
MPNTQKKKLFYPIDEVCDRLGLSLLDMAVLVSERKIRLSTAVPGLLVEDGHDDRSADGAPIWRPTDRQHVRGLVELHSDDAWHVLRSGSQMVFAFATGESGTRRLVDRSEDERGYVVIREEVGVRHEELQRYAALEATLEEITIGPRGGVRGSLPRYDWEAVRLEAFHRIYFEGVPESYGALIRHIQGWFEARGGAVPDESTLKRRLRDIWAAFGSEGKQSAA